MLTKGANNVGCMHKINYVPKILLRNWVEGPGFRVPNHDASWDMPKRYKITHAPSISLTCTVNVCEAPLGVATWPCIELVDDIWDCIGEGKSKTHQKSRKHHLSCNLFLIFSNLSRNLSPSGSLCSELSEMYVSTNLLGSWKNIKQCNITKHFRNQLK